jgi:hypothetical protein
LVNASENGHPDILVRGLGRPLGPGCAGELFAAILERIKRLAAATVEVGISGRDSSG